MGPEKGYRDIGAALQTLECRFNVCDTGYLEEVI